MARNASPTRARQVAIDVLRTLRAAGHTAYLAGGCVRDELLGLSPTDYDVATDATPDRIRALFPRTAEVGAAFGVVLVREGHVTVEVATFRSDGPYTDRRRPDSIRFSDPESDAQRRDFTVNALFLDPLDASGRPLPEGKAKVIDLVGGVADLERRVLRAVGDPAQRLAEDHLRALRAARLAARLGLSIEPATAAAIREHSRKLRGVSRERIGEEVRRMLAHPTRARAVSMMQDLLLDAPVLESAHDSRSPAALAALLPDAPYPTCLGAWALDRGLTLEADAISTLVETWRSALCLSNAERDDLQGVFLMTLVLEHDWDTMGVAAQKRAAGGGGVGVGSTGASAAGCGAFPQALSLMDARAQGEAPARIRRRVAELEGTPSGLCPRALLTGDDLVALGMKPGPRFKRILDRVYDAQLEDRVRTKQEAMELARSTGV